MSDKPTTDMIIPAFGPSPAIQLTMEKVYEAERRLIEAQYVNAGSYGDLEYSFGEGYREARRNLTVINYELTKAEKMLREAKAIALLDHYNDFIKDRKLKDSVDIRDAFLQQQPDYVAAQDRIDMLKAFESLMDGKMKVFENTSRFLKKEIDIILKSGFSGNQYTSRD